MQNSLIYEFSGSVTQLPLALHSLDSLTSNNSRVQVKNSVMHAGGGMIEGAQTQWPHVTTCMSVAHAEAMPTLEKSAQLHSRSKLSQQWESRPKYAQYSIWNVDELLPTTTASVTESLPPLP